MFVLHVTKFLSLRENYVMFITQRLPVVVQTLASSIVTWHKLLSVSAHNMKNTHSNGKQG